MTTMIDLHPATARVSRLILAVDDAQLPLATPCPDYSVNALLDHFMALTLTFALAAVKNDDPSRLAGESPPGAADAAHLDPDWRSVLPLRLAALADAWGDSEAWSGDTVAGVPLPAQLAGILALDEIVLHGWDLARAASLPYEPDPTDVRLLHDFIESIRQGDDPLLRDALFGETVVTRPGRSRWDRTVALAGRDPDWRG